MGKYELTEGEARLLVAVFDHLKPYYKQAKAKGTSVADEMNNDDEKIRCTYQTLLRRELSYGLTNRENKIIIRRYGLSEDGHPRTLEEIGREFGVTRERIRQIEARAIKKIRRFMTELNNTEARMATEALKAYKKGQYAQWMHAQENGDRGAVNAYVHNYRACVNAINKLKTQQNIRKHRSDDEQHSII